MMVHHSRSEVVRPDKTVNSELREKCFNGFMTHYTNINALLRCNTIIKGSKEEFNWMMTKVSHEIDPFYYILHAVL